MLAYTDSDCMADPDWLYYLIGTLVSGDYAGVGGPNVSPPAENWVQACVAAAPGGPSHVLLTDTVAEHIPGCNMAFYRWAFDTLAVSMSNIARRATTSIFAGACNRKATSSHLVRPRSSGIIAALR